MQSLTKTCSALAVAAALVVVPSGVNAQECTANLSPSQVEAGSDAVMVTVSLSENIGMVESIDAGDSGIEEASSTNIPRTEMAADEDEPQPIRQGSGQNSWTVWLNTSDAEPGTHPVTFETSDGTSCEAELQVIG